MWSGKANIGIATEGLPRFPYLVSFPCYWCRHFDRGAGLPTAAGVQTAIVLTAMGSDVTKQYVALGMGGGIVASMAFDHGRDKGLRAVEASHLFAPELKRADIDHVAHGNSENG